MSENLFCIGQKRLNARYDAGWEYAFNKPKLGKNVRKMLSEYIRNEEYRKCLIFFMDQCNASYDYSYFLLHRFIEGEL